MDGKALYELYRHEPPVSPDGRPHYGAAHRVAYWDGFYGIPRKQVRGSVAWWANKAGRDNRNKSAPNPPPKSSNSLMVTIPMPEGAAEPRKEFWEILVPTMTNAGKPIRTRFHRVWDAKVQKISGGLTIHVPTKGRWVHEGVLFHERMIPVRIMCTREQINEIIDITLEYYDQIAVLAYRVSDEVILKYRPAKKGKKNG